MTVRECARVGRWLYDDDIDDESLRAIHLQFLAAEQDVAGKSKHH